MLRPGFVGMRGQWSDDYGMHDHEYTPPSDVLKVVRPLTSHPYDARTEHTEFSPEQPRNKLPSTKRRGNVVGESHEG